MAAPVLPPFPLRLGSAAALLGLLALGGCQMGGYQDSVLPNSGVQPLKGLAQNVSVRRNAMGAPLIESSNFHDALFSLGYLHAGDRIEQMVAMRLLAQGRLAELAGADALAIDRLMRAANLKQNAGQLYADASPRLKRFFEVYARGVNAYLFRYRDKLPGELARSGYRPEYWKPEDSALIFSLYAFSQSVNLQEELSALTLAQKVGADKLVWLLPGAPDDPLADSEVDKLKGLNLASQLPGLGALAATGQQLADLGLLGAPGSSNLALAPQRSRAGKSLLASDSRAAWALSPVQIHTGKYQVAGLSLPGLPIVLAGYNGKLAWSSSAVMADNQDLFLEQVRRQGTQLTYLADGKWQPARARNETFFVRGQRPQREVMYDTRHGTLLPGHGSLALALHLPQLKDDRSLDALFDLTRAQNIERAFDSTREVGAAALNFVFAEPQHIGWQVSGRYPNRREGQGLLPSPGWDGRYDWDGYADAMLHPYDQDPPAGFIGHANQRSLPKGYGMQLSSSWYYPERAERMAQLAGNGRHDSRSLMALQNDQVTLLADKLKQMFDAPGMAQPLKQAIDALPGAQRDKARDALARLKAFDGRLSPVSADAALYELFLQAVTRQTFLDELGPESSPAWQAFIANAKLSYSAQSDHLLGREDSPFWDDRGTPQKEDKPTILARSLAAAVDAGTTQLGADRRAWQWGKLHQYRWPAPAYHGLGDKLERAPLAAGGDFSTLALTPYAWGSSFDTQLPASARMIVDFGQTEPLQLLTSNGQSGNPASRHYSDGLDAWFKGRFTSLPLQPQNFARAYGSQRLTLVPGK
ncbi:MULTISPECIES: penicillin acylase family protein [unclassified Pseudomonas]|uniref:penicillin acylase family protein n=1 Tax=unclassified Pseudomonas TaxID=196821 RepID=UPI000C882599|nr:MULTISPECIES: penicillin acylase family protein [unclassified Pseudomonas]PMZ91248.1 penicillin acylase family protein [Pseudomonas sp. FW305-42]PNA20250.1 penicillin acylase family protein [Pseudomonas sp. MPR-R1B]PNB24458.1 penicillin acylase family protein [Pseudomonas sp. DP16D-E2]PNB40857.1 penicillin acylase family protein [Pseudomonas sp. FW305-17]PNB56366.1 penicillin acylase family protein [Pseudomonas sp. GW531-E2]